VGQLLKGQAAVTVDIQEVQVGCQMPSRYKRGLLQFIDKI